MNTKVTGKALDNRWSSPGCRAAAACDDPHGSKMLAHALGFARAAPACVTVTPLQFPRTHCCATEQVAGLAGLLVLLLLAATHRAPSPTNPELHVHTTVSRRDPAGHWPAIGIELGPHVRHGGPPLSLTSLWPSRPSHRSATCVCVGDYAN